MNNPNTYKIPVRSAISDSELSSMIRRDMNNRPSEFSITESKSSGSVDKFKRASSVSDVISKWL